MPDWLPLPGSRPLQFTVAVLYVLFVGYAVVFAGMALLGVLPLVVFAGLYLVWRFLVAVQCLERIADTLESDASDT